jgi:hypothetical protein
VAVPPVAGSIDIVLDQHAGTLRAAPGEGRPRVTAIDLAPATETLLREASQLHVELRVVLADALDDAAIAELQPLVAIAELVAGLDRLVLRQAPAVLVAADRVVRERAFERGWTPVPHPALALPVLLGEIPAFYRLDGELEAIRAVPGILPYWVETPPDGPAWALAALTGSALARALDARLGLQQLPLDLGLDDPLFVQLDEGAHAGEALAGYEVLWADGSRVLLALDAATSNDAIPAHGAHGHFRFLTPSPELLAPARVLAPAARPTGFAALQAAAEPAPVTAQSLLADVARYAGLAPLDGAGAIRSRHTSHRDNQRAVDALLAELRELGLNAFAHEFAFGGRILRNVLADLPGSGELGSDAGVVIVGCHLDSTAARDPGYVPASGPARGADDDGSGIAALLAIARHLRSVGEPLHNTVRFGFFNAEESGLVGSRAYAAAVKAARTPVTAVVCADMIGYNSDEQRTWEVHAGHTNPAVRDLSVPLAKLVADAAAQLGELPAAQIYSGTAATGGSDPARFDGAINRSDHASFHEQGYPAVLISEDFFPNRPSDPAADPNPNYHSDADVEIDGRYAAEITRAMSLAVLDLASRPGVLIA